VGVFLVELQYEQEVSKFDKKDAIIAIIFFFVYFILITAALAALYVRTDLSEGTWQIIRNTSRVINLLIIVTIVKLRGQTLASIGLHGKNVRAAVVLGLGLAPIFLAARFVPGFTGGWQLQSDTYIFILLNVALAAIREDISFVGFVQTRLHGLVKNKNSAINLGAAFFMLAHLPSRLIQGVDMPVILFLLLMVNWFFMHRAFVILFKRYYSIIPVFIMHLASNFPSPWQGDGSVPAWVTVIVPTVIFVVIVEFWHDKWNKKNETESSWENINGDYDS